MFDKWQYWLFICNKCRKYLLRVRVVRGRPWMGQRGSTGESGLSRQWSGCTAVSYSVSVLLCCHLEWHELEHSRQELQQRFFEDYDTFFILWHDIYSRKKWNPNACPAFYSFFWCCPKGIIDTKIGMPLLLLFLKYVYDMNKKSWCIRVQFWSFLRSKLAPPEPGSGACDWNVASESMVS